MTTNNTDTDTDTLASEIASDAPTMVEIAPGASIPANYTTPDGITISYAERWSRRISGSNLVAGSIAEGKGLFAEWRGNRPMTRAACGRALARAELPRDWMPPAPSAQTQLREAISDVLGARYVIRSAKRPKMPPSGVRAPEDAWRARYAIVRDRQDDGEQLAPGDAWGRVFLVCTLWIPSIPDPDPDAVANPDGTPAMIDGAPSVTWHVQPNAEERALDHAVREALALRREEIAGRIETTWRERMDAAVVPTKMVSRWLANVLRWNLGGAGLGKGYYVPAECRMLAAALCASLRDGTVPPDVQDDASAPGIPARDVSALADSPWGTPDAWLTIGVASDAELSRGLARTYQYEIEKLAITLGNLRAMARKSDKIEISVKCAMGWQKRFESKIVEMRRHEAIMGPEIFTECANLIADQVILLDGILEAHERGDYDQVPADGAVASQDGAGEAIADAPGDDSVGDDSFAGAMRAANAGALQSYPSADDAPGEWARSEIERADADTFGVDAIPEPVKPSADDPSFRDHWETSDGGTHEHGAVLDVRYGV
jgi:hypothetical protein